MRGTFIQTISRLAREDSKVMLVIGDTGFSVMEYIIYSRVLRARQLLQEGVSVQQAGELSGFSDNSHFIRTFGHLTGLTPGRYAKEYQSGDQVLLRGEL